MQLAPGDTLSPLVFAMQGILSPFGADENKNLELVRGETTLLEVVNEISDLLKDCDDGHTALRVSLPDDTDAHTLAVQWALTSTNFLKIVETLKAKAALPTKEQSRDDYAQAAALYGMLLTRFMTFVKNGVVPGSSLAEL